MDMNTNYKFSVSPVWAERIERTSELVGAGIAIGVWAACAVVLAVLVFKSIGPSASLTAEPRSSIRLVIR